MSRTETTRGERMGYFDFKTDAANAQPALYLGTYSSGSQINVTSKYSNYASLTASNFIVEPIGGSTSGSYSKSHDIKVGGWTIYLSGSYSASCSFNKTYNASTGVLSITNTVSRATNGSLYDYSGGSVYEPYSSSGTSGLSAKVYLVPDIEDAS